MAPGFYRPLRPEHLPMPDGQVMQLIQYVLREDADIRELNRLIAFNPALTAQILGVVNSAFFRSRNPIPSLADALVTLGMAQLKSLVLCFAVKEALSMHPVPGLDIGQFWGDSVFRGVAAQQLGRTVKGPEAEAFSAGMLQDIGLLALFAMEPDKADRWPLLRANLPDRRREMETQLFQTTHDQIGRILTEKWHLPEAYARAIGTHHHARPQIKSQAGSQAGNTATPPRDPDEMLVALAFLADLCSAVFTSHDKGRALALLEDHARDLFGLSRETLHGLLERLPDQVDRTARAMKLSPPPREEFTEILGLAGREMARTSLSFQELTWQLQQTLKERDEAAARLEAEMDTARDIQAGLLPDLTGRRDVAAFNLPARHLSGDFYDFLTLGDGSAAFCLGDVSGKGTAAALLMAKTLSLFRWLARSGLPLEHIMVELNRSLGETAVRGMFVTLAAGTLRDGQLSLINMGHPPPLLFSGTQLIQIQASGPPLGILDQVAPRAVTRPFNRSRLFLYSDGFLESRLGKDPGQVLGARGFIRWLAQSAGMGIQEQAQWMETRCTTHLDGKSDDLTLMILAGDS